MYKLLLQTKSNKHFTADVVIAYTTASALSLGWWIDTLKANLTPEELAPDAFILAHPNGLAWTSHYYMHTFLYPALTVCRALGDPFLRTIPLGIRSRNAFGVSTLNNVPEGARCRESDNGLYVQPPTPRLWSTVDGACHVAL
jgi:hypothetical protein